MSYSTVEVANDYIATHYMSTDDVRVRWESLVKSDKQALLNKAYDVINSLPLRGCKTDVEQDGAFPRCGSKTVPNAVISAEIELAATLTDIDQMNAVSEYKRKADYGISSYRVGNFSETILSYASNSLQLQYGLVSTEAERFLLPWLNGGFCIE